MTALRLTIEADTESELAVKLLALVTANSNDAWLDPKVRVKHSEDDRCEARKEERSDLSRLDRVSGESPHPTTKQRLVTPFELSRRVKKSASRNNSEPRLEPPARLPNSRTRGQETPVDDETNGYFETILELGKLEGELRLTLEAMAQQESEECVRIEQARSLAAQQAREIFTCDVCGLQFLGVLAFAAHDEATTHLKNRGRRVVIDGRLVHDSAYRPLSGF